MGSRVEFLTGRRAHIHIVQAITHDRAQKVYLTDEEPSIRLSNDSDEYKTKQKGTIDFLRPTLSTAQVVEAAVAVVESVSQHHRQCAWPSSQSRQGDRAAYSPAPNRRQRKRRSFRKPRKSASCSF